MNKTSAIILIIAVVAVIGLIFAFRPAKSPQTPLPSPSQTTPTPSAESAKQNSVSQPTSITIKNFAFSPADLKIAKGTKIIWTNEDSVPHAVKFDFLASETLSKGQSFSHAFNETGAFNYICGIHPFMKAKITIQ